MTTTIEMEIEPVGPSLTGAPDSIWLVYGDIDRDSTHHECVRGGEVLWCEDKQFPADQRYVHERFIKHSGLDTFTIHGAQQSDGGGTFNPVTVILQDTEDGAGTLTVTCWGLAWTCRWGAMDCRLKEFIAESDADYLALALIRGRSQFPSEQNIQQRELAYLVDIVHATQATIRKERTHG